MEIDLQLDRPAGSISRTAMEAHHRCPRYRFLAYEWMRGLPITLPDGSSALHCGGLSPAKPSSALLTGAAIHEGFAHLLETFRGIELNLSEGTDPFSPFGPGGWRGLRTSGLWHLHITAAADVALAHFDAQAAAEGISFGLDPGSADFYEKEQRALVEGLVWVAGLRLVPELLSRYKVVEVEREERMELGPDVREFAARADALLAERDSGDLSVFSLKTGTIYGRREEMRFKRDVQGLSEAIALERRLGAKIETVQMALLLKGLRRMNDRAGRKEHYSPLTRAWRSIDPLSSIETWCWSYDTPKTSRDGSAYMGKLGKDFTSAPTWERPGGIREWVLALDRGEIQSEVGDPFENCLAIPEPWSRSENEVQDWLEQSLVREREIEAGAEAVNLNLQSRDLDSARRQLNVYFPQNRSSCVQFNTTCFADVLCWRGDGLVQLAQGMAPEGMIPRRDHHQMETEDE